MGKTPATHISPPCPRSSEEARHNRIQPTYITPQYSNAASYPRRQPFRPTSSYITPQFSKATSYPGRQSIRPAPSCITPQYSAAHTSHQRRHNFLPTPSYITPQHSEAASYPRNQTFQPVPSYISPQSSVAAKPVSRSRRHSPPTHTHSSSTNLEPQWYHRHHLLKVLGEGGKLNQVPLTPPPSPQKPYQVYQKAPSHEAFPFPTKASPATKTTPCVSKKPPPSSKKSRPVPSAPPPALKKSTHLQMKSPRVTQKTPQRATKILRKTLVLQKSPPDPWEYYEVPKCTPSVSKKTSPVPEMSSLVSRKPPSHKKSLPVPKTSHPVPQQPPSVSKKTPPIPEVATPALQQKTPPVSKEPALSPKKSSLPTSLAVDASIELHHLYQGFHW